MPLAGAPKALVAGVVAAGVDPKANPVEAGAGAPKPGVGVVVGFVVDAIRIGSQFKSNYKC